MHNSTHQNSPMQASAIPSKPAKYFLTVAASLMLTFAFTGCTAAGPLQSHSAFKQSALPSGYQSVYQNQPTFAPQSSPQFSPGSSSRTLGSFAGSSSFASGGSC